MINLVMTLLVRDEEDILALNLEHHLAQGVDRFIVTDNRSTDRTPQILRRYVERGLVECIQEPGDTYSQAAWVSRMAERAAATGASWVIHSDADEFWIARQPGLRLRDVVEQCFQRVTSFLAATAWVLVLPGFTALRRPNRSRDNGLPSGPS